MKLTLTKSRLFNFLTVASHSMEFVLVSLLILDLLSHGQSSTKATTESCYRKCPPGYHKVDNCARTEQHRCEKCADGTFTDIENTKRSCERCRDCSGFQIVLKNCTFKSDAECDCKKNYYNASSNPNELDCQLCPCSSCKGPKNRDSRRQCQDCTNEEVSWCLNNKECLRICGGFLPLPVTIITTATSTTSSATTTTTALMDMTSTSTRTTASNSSSSPVIIPVPDNSVNHLPWLILVGTVIIFLVVFLLLLLLLPRNPNRYPDCFPCWIANKNLGPPVEETKFNDQRSHQGNGPTMLTLTISEETPMMPLSQSPATSEHQAPHSSPVLPDAEHKAARQDKQFEHWPAIVLYAIIKEVPLRRWKEFLRLLSVADQQLERVELEAGFGLSSMERQYQMLRLWSQRSTASLDDVFSALHYMDLSGCAQLLQESLEKLKWRPFTDSGFNGVMQET